MSLRPFAKIWHFLRKWQKVTKLAQTVQTGPGILARGGGRFLGLGARIWHFLRKCQKMAKLAQTGQKRDPPRIPKMSQNPDFSLKNGFFLPKTGVDFDERRRQVPFKRAPLGVLPLPLFKRG